jgi:hypothetical protein
LVDKVKPLKMESPASGGTETDPFPTETNTASDYLATKGIAFENLDTVFIDKSGNDMRFKDITNTANLTLMELRFHEKWQFAQDITATTTTSTAVYTTKVTFTTPTLVAGNYWIGWKAKFSTSGANRSVQFQWREGATVLETGQAFSPNLVATNHFSGKQVRTLAAGSFTYLLEFRTGTAGAATSTCSNALIWIMRVS